MQSVLSTPYARMESCFKCNLKGSILGDVIQNCQFFLMYSFFLIAIAMAEVPIPTNPVASVYGPILHISSLSVKVHFQLCPRSLPLIL